MSAVELNKARSAAQQAEAVLEKNSSPDATRLAQTWVGIGNLWANIDRSSR